MPKRRKNILSQMFDVRPLKEDGSLHWEKINAIKKCVNLKPQKKSINNKNSEKAFLPIMVNYYQPGKRNDQQLADSNQPPAEIIHDPQIKIYGKSEREKILAELEEILENGKSPIANNVSATIKKDEFWEVVGRHDLKIQNQESNNKELASPLLRREKISKKKSPIFRFAILASFLPIFILGYSYIQISNNSKEAAMSYAAKAQELMSDAKEDLKNLDFKSANSKFYAAGENFEKSKEAIGKINYTLLSATSGLPFLSSKISGINLVSAGEYFAKSGEILSKDMANIFSVDAKDIFQPDGKSKLLVALKKLSDDSEEALIYANLAEKKIEKVDKEALPVSFKDKDIGGKIKEAKSGIIELQYSVKILIDLLGGWREQNYLLLFQNPAEIRATGGFIGSYGIVKLDNGKIKKIFIDDIFNPDGQLKEKIIPPAPIQKISTAWSMHDANWFFDFPTSAKKIAGFYEKTGGETASAVVAINPFIVEKFLDITGPVDMPEYSTIISAENFIDIVQFKVEKDFDKEDNKPKKILADFMPKLIEKLFSQKNGLADILKILAVSLKEKDIMLYSFDSDIQKIILDNGFSGEVLESKNDYLAVVSSNVNGYKTDRMIEGGMDLRSEISEEGFITNTLTIRKHHIGGESKYDYYNKVNTDYLRVYVPKGSQLIDASGHTLENNNPPVDYKKLEFKEDKDVADMESSLKIDQKTGTQIFEESDKTVFANWVFVSPQETADIIYKYRLPKRIDFNNKYQMIFQKQSGSNMKLNWQIDFLGGGQIVSDSKDLFISGSSASLKIDFKEDKIIDLKVR